MIRILLAIVSAAVSVALFLRFNWLLPCVVAALLVGALILTWPRRERITARDDVDALLRRYGRRPTDFERYVAEIYRRRGYRVHVTQQTGDCGRDIEMKRGGRLYVVEVKLYSPGLHVGREKIQKLQGAMIDAQAHGAIFVTTSKFTRTAIDYAQRNGIELVDGDALEAMIQEVIGG